MPLLAAQTQATNQVTVAVNVALGQVLQQALAATNQKKQATTGVVIMLVGLQVLGQLTNALREQGDLCLRGTGVGLMKTVLGQDFLLLLSGKSHENLPHQYFSPHEKTAA